MPGNELEAVVKLRGDTSGARSELQKFNRTLGEVDGSIRRSQSGVADLFGPLAARIGTAAVAAGVLKIGTSAIKAASDLAELRSAAQVTFAEGFANVEARAAGIAQEVGRARSSVLGFATDMGAIITPMGLGSRAVQDMSLGLSKLSIDLASFRNTSDADAFLALRSAIVGETEPMRRYGVVLTQANLSTYALKNGIKQKIDAMNQAQLVALRYNYILSQTTLAQGDAARTADGFANQSRKLKDEWKTLMEELGKAAAPAASKVISVLSFLVRTFTNDMKDAIGAWGQLQAMIGDKAQILKPLGTSLNILGSAGKSLLGGNGPKPTYLSKTAGPEVPAWMKQDADVKGQIEGLAALGGGKAGGGEGKSAQDELKQLTDQIAHAESEILQLIGEQAQARADTVRKLRDDLKLKKEMGIIEKDEERTLERINHRMEYKDELLQEAIESWKSEARAVDEAEKKVKELNDRIGEENKRRQEAMTKLDQDAAEDKIQTATRVMKEINDIRERGTGAFGLSADDSYKIGQLQDQLKGYGGSTLEEAGRMAGLSPSELTDRETERKKEQARQESDERLAGLRAEMSEAEKSLAELTRTEQEKAAIVIQSLNERNAATDSILSQIEARTKLSIDRQVAEYNRLRSSATALTPGNPQTGGNVTVSIGNVEVKSQSDMDALVARITRAIQLQQVNAN